jgi:UTP:GlnB (protein PII) uridylyltransferase
MISKNKLSDITIDRIKSGELKDIIPEFYRLKTVIENNDWHDNQNVFDHTLNVMKEILKILKLDFIKDKKLRVKIIHTLNSKIENYSRRGLLFFATLLHDIAKVETLQINESKRTSCPNHETEGSLKVGQIGLRFGLGKDDILFVKEIVRAHGIPHTTIDIKKDKDTLLKDFEKIKNNYPKIYLELLLLAMADTLGSDLEKNLPNEYNFRINFLKEVLNDYIKNL